MESEDPSVEDLRAQIRKVMDAPVDKGALDRWASVMLEGRKEIVYDFDPDRHAPDELFEALWGWPAPVLTIEEKRERNRKRVEALRSDTDMEDPLYTFRRNLDEEDHPPLSVLRGDPPAIWACDKHPDFQTVFLGEWHLHLKEFHPRQYRDLMWDN